MENVTKHEINLALIQNKMQGKTETGYRFWISSCLRSSEQISYPKIQRINELIGEMEFSVNGGFFKTDAELDKHISRCTDALSYRNKKNKYQ